MAACLAACLGIGGGTAQWGAWGNALREVELTLSEADTQWMVLACFSVYFFGLAALNYKVGNLGKCQFWLGVGLFAGGLLSYAVAFDHATVGTHALALCFGQVVYQGIAFWYSLEYGRAKRVSIDAAVVLVVLLFLSSSVWAKARFFAVFSYRGLHRWSGWWDNPNMSGVLMAVGVVLAVGWIISPKAKAESGKLKAEMLHWIRIILLAGAAVICGIGLVKSYCRGAWVGAAVGLSYLVWNYFNHEMHQIHETVDSISENPCNPCRRFSWLRRNWLPVTAILISLLTLAFWNFRHTEHVPTRRIASAANVNDFSSRNRVVAWEGALQMAAQKPLLGFGWNMQDDVYEQLYLPAKLEGFRAIRTNDYFKLANMLGIPALFCFVAFIGLNLMRSAECGMRNEERAPHPSPLLSAEREKYHPSLALACRAGVVVLLVSFWFDGADSGLFRLASGSMFWILLALGSAEKVAGSQLRVENGGGK